MIDVPLPGDGPPRTPGGPRLVVLVLGPLRVEGLRQPIRRKAVIRLLVHLALNLDRAVPSDRVRFALATDQDNEPSEETVYNYASHLRRSLPEGMLPGNQPGGYRLGPGIEVDWAIFQALVAQADTTPADRPRLLTAALAQVRGEPLADTLWPGVEADVRHIVATVETAARSAASMFLAAFDARQAEWAIHQGLLASPACPGLWEDRMVAAAAGSGYGLQRAWDTAQRALAGDATLIEGTYQALRTATV